MPGADPDFIMKSVLTGPAPWVELSGESSLKYGLFGGNSPFANWVGDNPREWEHFPTPESLFLSARLGKEIEGWLRVFGRALEKLELGSSKGQERSVTSLATEGLALCEEIRRELPYYYVTPTFVEWLPVASMSSVETASRVLAGYRLIDGKQRGEGPPSVDFSPLEGDVVKRRQSRLPDEVVQMVEQLHLTLPDLGREFWDRLEEWQMEFTENYIGFPRHRGGEPRWRPGFDRLRWFADGLLLQQDFSAKSPGLKLNCNAAIVAVSKSEWDTFMKAYSSSSA